MDLPKVYLQIAQEPVGKDILSRNLSSHLFAAENRLKNPTSLSGALSVGNVQLAVNDSFSEVCRST